jgi:toxin ParE1/3/4
VKEIEFHPDAEAELNAAAEYYEQQREGLGLDLAAAVQQATEHIRRFPQASSVHLEGLGIRKCVVRHFPYNILYAELEDRIWIVAVAHQRRRPDYWRSRLSG